MTMAAVCFCYGMWNVKFPRLVWAAVVVEAILILPSAVFKATEFYAWAFS